LTVPEIVAACSHVDAVKQKRSRAAFFRKVKWGRALPAGGFPAWEYGHHESM
jgi:hypothetical protein